MFYEVAAVARDWALILLALEAMLLCVLPLVVLWVGARQLREFLPRVRPGLRNLHGIILRVSRDVDRALAAIRAPFLWAEGVQARVRAFCRAWKRI